MSSVDSQPLPPGHRFGGGRSPCALHEHVGWAPGIPGKAFCGKKRWGLVYLQGGTSYQWSYGAPINKVITPVVPIYMAIYSGYKL